jgi:hypothetical protein
MSYIVKNLLEDIFGNNYVGYLIVDLPSRTLLSRFYLMDHLVINGIVEIFDIANMITSGKQLTDGSKKKLSNNQILYLIKPTQNNIDLIGQQLQYFDQSVRIIFIHPLDNTALATLLSNLAKVKNANKIVSVRSLPIDPDCYVDRVDVDKDLFRIVDKGYNLIPNIPQLTTTPFVKMLREKTENILEPCKGKHKTLIISLPRNFDLVTLYMIPWHYGSMIRYYMNLTKDIVYYDDNTFAFSQQTDPYYNKWKNLSFDALTHEINSTMKTLKQHHDEIKQQSLDKKNVAHEFIEVNRNIKMVKKHFQVLTEINSMIGKYKSIDLSGLQYSILNGIDRTVLFDDLEKYTLQYTDNMKRNKPFCDVITLATIIYPNIFISTKYEQYIDPYISSVSTTAQNKPIDLNNIIKKTTIDTNQIGKMIMTGVDGMMNLNKKKDIIKPLESTYLEDLEITQKGHTLYEKKQSNELLSHVPVIGVLIDLLLGCDRDQAIQLNQRFIDMKKSTNTQNALNGVDQIIIHIDQMITYEEIRSIDLMICRSDRRKLNVIFHTDMIK